MNTMDQNSAYHSKKIDLKESLDVSFWCEEFSLCVDELKEIVKTVGPLVHDVRVHLAKKLLVRWPQNY